MAFQPGLEHFGDEAGFLSYKTVGKTALVLSNPMAAPDKRRALVDRFIVEKGDICFWQISRPVAEILATLGFSINEMGTESHIDLANYNCAGPELAKRNLRKAHLRVSGSVAELTGTRGGVGEVAPDKIGEETRDNVSG